MPVDPEDLLVDWQQRAAQQAELSTELSRRMQEITAGAESPGGEVTTTVDHAGGLAGLRLSPAAMRLPADELAELILGTSRRAQAKLAARMADLVTGLYGADSPTAAFVAGTYAEQFPRPERDEEERDRR